MADADRMAMAIARPSHVAGPEPTLMWRQTFQLEREEEAVV